VTNAARSIFRRSPAGQGNFCSSCRAKRSVLFAEKLADGILAPVPHRHWTFSIPRVLRGLFERERSLSGLLSQTAYAAIQGAPVVTQDIDLWFENPSDPGICEASRDVGAAYVPP